RVREPHGRRAPRPSTPPLLRAREHQRPPDRGDHEGHGRRTTVRDGRGRPRRRQPRGESLPLPSDHPHGLRIQAPVHLRGVIRGYPPTNRGSIPSTEEAERPLLRDIAQIVADEEGGPFIDRDGHALPPPPRGLPRRRHDSARSRGSRCARCRSHDRCIRRAAAAVGIAGPARGRSMRRPGFLTGAAIGALLAAPLLTILYLAQQLLGLPFAAFDLFDWLARRLPGGLVTFGIGAMVAAIRRVGVADTSAAAKTAEQGLAIAGLFLALVVAGAVLFAVLRRTRWSGIIAGLVLGALAGGAAPVVREADWRLRIGRPGGRPAELSLAPGRSARRLRADASVHHARVHLEPRR